MTEQKLQNKIINYLKSENIYHFKVISANKAGIPDIIACVDGKFFAIEVKTEVGVVSKLQHYNIKLILRSNGYAVIARSLEDVIERVEFIRGI
jgi:Holliday junction resolvase